MFTLLYKVSSINRHDYQNEVLNNYLTEKKIYIKRERESE